MPRISLYAQNRHTLILDGVPIQGFGEGDFIDIKQDGNAAERTLGADGPSMNLSTEQGGTLTIGLKPTSPAIGTMYALRKQQSRNPRLFSIVLISGVEEIISAGGCGFGDMPQFSTGGPTMQTRQFLIQSLKIDMDESAVEAIEGGILGGLI